MSVISFKCPNCDGELIFDPATGKYKCEYCMSLFSQAELDEMKPAASAEEKASPEEEAVVYSCPSCGAEVVTDATTAAAFCYYCHNPVILKGRISGKYLPDKIIPFKIGKEEAERKFLEYVGTKKFVPRAFFQKKQIEKLSGIYFPYWMYDTELNGSILAKATKVSVWRSDDEEYTETKFYHVERSGDIELKSRIESALNKANKTLVEGVLPYETRELKAFTMGYLSGFQAEKRDIEKDKLEPQIKSEMNEYGEKLLRGTIQGYSSVNIKGKSFQVKKDMWNYMLLPVWTVTYRSRNGKLYYFSLNGQTGKVCGELPIDYKKLSLVSGIAAFGVLIAGLIGGYYLG